MSDSTFYQNNSPDTNNVFVWNVLYEEMYFSAHDTTWMETVEDITNYPYQFSGDTIVMGIMDYDFYYFLPGVLNSGSYFTFDELGNQLFDHPNPISSPYGRSNIFAAAALKQDSYFSNPVFRIDPNMFFTDNANAPIYTDPQALRIDFGDGTGWHYFDMSQTSHYEAFYDEAGQVIIRVEVFDWLLDRAIKGSNCEISIMQNRTMVKPDELIFIPGLNVGAYHSCEDTEDQNRKVVIYLEGFDPLDFIPSQNNTIEKNYDKMIAGEGQYPGDEKYIGELQNFGYSFYVVDYKKSTIDLRINALHVLNLIEYLKNEYAYNEEQFVVIGHSMGGIIARYVLSYMESDYYASGDYSPFLTEIDDPQTLLHLLSLFPQYSFEELIHVARNGLGSLYRNDELVHQMHKVRTLITLDSPHQGASIPLAYQQFYKKGILHLTGHPSNPLTNAFNILLDSKGSKQLLLNHIDATPDALEVSNSGNYTEYTAHSHRLTFLADLQDLGNYPQYCKLVAYSSADMGGSNQVTFFDENVLRTPNDPFADFQFSLKAKILYIPVSLREFQFRLLSNPQGTALVYRASIGHYLNLPQVFIFGININSSFLDNNEDIQYAVNAKPYCTSAAGYYLPTKMNLVSGNSFSSSFNLSDISVLGINLPNLFSYTVNNSQGCFDLASHVGINGFASVNVDLSMCSNGLYFGFVSLQSALDYGNGLNLPLNHNIQAENINTKLSRTPFDLIIGYTDGKNHNHSREYYDPLIYNLTTQPAYDCYEIELNTNNPEIAKNYSYAYYDANLQSKCEVKRSLLCLEIGDEEMYLENWTLNRPARFSAQYDMYVNERNPYYEYTTQDIDDPKYFGIYSKQAPFLINTNGYAYFVHNQSNSPNAAAGYGFIYENDVAPTEFWYAQDDEMVICVNDYAKGKSAIAVEEQSLKPLTNYLHLYPNPNNGEVMMLEYDFQDENPVHLEIYDLSGKRVYGLQNLAEGENKIRLHLGGLDSGLYLVRLHNATHSQTTRLIIH